VGELLDALVLVDALNPNTATFLKGRAEELAR
jgi:hypothetical protein